ncbi:MAG: hypothetical protein DHS20C15_07670 [Planctomycetota bacterium]|nr:MAG: hypothetical protein DHS20C15_07670 [Planctomycetota bacterium]
MRTQLNSPSRPAIARAPLSRRLGVICGALLAALALAPDSAAFDLVLLKDGRVVEGKLLSDGSDGTVLLRLPAADIPISMDLIDKTFVEDLENYVPKSKMEEDQIKKGRVLFEGSWMSRTRRETKLKARRDRQAADLEQSKRDHDWRNHKTVEKRHLVIRSNCTDEVIEEFGELLEVYYKAFTDYWNIKPAASIANKKMSFYFYRTKPDFHRVTKMSWGIGGFFRPLSSELQLYYDLLDPQGARETLFHEGNHWLTHLIDPGFHYPSWLNEGMAEYYGTAEVNEKGDFQLGGLQYGRIVSLRNDAATGNELKLRDVMVTPQSEFRARHYAVAWSFNHFLMESEDYNRPFRAFFKGLPDNPDVDVEVRSYSNAVIRRPDLSSVVSAFEKAMGKDLDALEDEWRLFQTQAYGELTANAYYLAARISTANPLDDDEHIVKAMEYYQKAVDLGIEQARCYQNYAEMLRKGGVKNGSYIAIVAKPQPEKAWEMIERAIELDPVNPYNYTEAAGILLLDGASQDLDRAFNMVETALALNSTDYTLRSLTSELTSKIEPARKALREREELARMMRENDQRKWIVQPGYLEGEEVPAQMADLSTEDVLALIEAGAVKAGDYIFQSFRRNDAETGEPMEGTERWDKEWVFVSEVPDFAEAAAAQADG